jgi:RNA polymerase sigma-19 factor, ECF subfamily
LRDRVAKIKQPADIKQLYKDTSDELRRFLVRKLGNHQEAEEVAHDAYLKLCRIEHKDDIRDLRKYLFTVSVRLALNVLRKRKYENAYLQVERSAINLDSESDSRSAYSLLLTEVKLDAVKQTLAQLPEKTRYVFLQRRFSGLTYDQISEKLGMSKHTVRYHMGRAVEQINMAMQEFEVTDDGCYE